VTFPSIKLLGFSSMVTMEGQIGEGLTDDLCGCLERRRDWGRMLSELASSCTWLFLQNFEKGLLSARDKRGEQSGEGEKWESVDQWPN
jgi:hypothetical protein